VLTGFAVSSNGAGSLYTFAHGAVTTLYTFPPFDAHTMPLTVPGGTPIVAPGGRVYGTTLYGGTGPCPQPGTTSPAGCGTIFEYSAQ
jgi:hypothetical protein